MTIALGPASRFNQIMLNNFKQNKDIRTNLLYKTLDLSFGLDAESLLSFLPEYYQQMAYSYINEAVAQARSMDVAKDNALKVWSLI